MSIARNLANLGSQSLATSSDLSTGLATKRDVTDGYVYMQTIYYTSSGTFSKGDYPWLRAIKVVCQGAGGGGCGRTSGSNTAPGGGGGMYAESFITDISSLPSSVTVTVGAGGSGGLTSGANSGGITAGTNGGNSSFGDSPTVVRGAGGYSGGYYDGSFGRATDSIGDLIIHGGGTDASYVGTQANGQSGGGSFMAPRSRGHQAGSGTPTGSSGKNYGGGGAGAPAIKPGGVGGSGIVIVELYA